MTDSPCMAYLKITTILNGFSTLFTLRFYCGMFTLGEITLTCHSGFQERVKNIMDHTWQSFLPMHFCFWLLMFFNWLGGLTQLLLTELTEVAIDATSWYWCHLMPLDVTCLHRPLCWRLLSCLWRAASKCTMAASWQGWYCIWYTPPCSIKLGLWQHKAWPIQL